MSRVAKNLAGARYGRLCVVDRAGEHGKQPQWRCVCDCGRTTTCSTHALVSGRTRSCGCLARELAPLHSIKHGRSGAGDPTYRAWLGMKRRCYQPSCKDYANYGGRGITVCERWRTDFALFLADVGERPSGTHSIDRIDGSGDYEPGNVRWATPAEQSRNTRRTRFFSMDGRSMCLKDWTETLGISYPSMIWRLNTKGESFETAVMALVDRKAAP